MLTILGVWMAIMLCMVIEAKRKIDIQHEWVSDVHTMTTGKMFRGIYGDVGR
jgi:hypothetical protein